MVSWETPGFLRLTKLPPKKRHSHNSIHYCLYSLSVFCVLQCPFDLFNICLASFISWELPLLVWLLIFSFCSCVEFVLLSTTKDRKKQTKPPNIKKIWSPRNLWTKKYLTYVSWPGWQKINEKKMLKSGLSVIVDFGGLSLGRQGDTFPTMARWEANYTSINLLKR